MNLKTNNLKLCLNLKTVPNNTSGDNSTKPGAKKLIAGNIMSAVQKAQRLTPSHRRKKKSKIIEELKIFDAELEAQPEFNGFTDLFHSFELYRGKVKTLINCLKNKI